MIFFPYTSAHAQMPGLELAKKAEPAADTVVATRQSETASVAEPPVSLLSRP
ncbi:MAG: hypothetical protein ABIH89_10870 [Elusimicrobiota bacterium]